jgi:alpha-tubulin suppressor-like RCC1 family protein
LIHSLKNIVKVECGSEFTMVLDKDGKLYAFGQNGYGQLGVVGKSTKVTEPKLIVLSAANGRVIDFSCGEEHAALLDEHGHVHTWGFGNDGQLGHGDRNSLNTPKKVTFNGLVKKVGCGGGHTGFLTNEGDLYLMGRGRDG